MMGRIRSTGKLVQRTFEVEGNKRTVVEIQVTHVGPDLQFTTAEVVKSTAEGLSSTSDGSPRSRSSKAPRGPHLEKPPACRRLLVLTRKKALRERRWRPLGFNLRPIEPDLFRGL
jgi:single-stranded DNA-binding protein